MTGKREQMSEQTGGENQKPDPDKDKEPGRDQNPDDVQDQSPGPVFSDPTAPIWADPTAQMPTPGPPAASPTSSTAPGTPFPHGAHAADPYGPGQSSPSGPPASNPYAQQPPVQSYGQQPYGQAGAPQYPGGPQYPGYGQQSYSTGSTTQTNGSAIALTIVSALSLCNFFCAAPLIMGIIALTRNSTDPEASRRLTKIGWIVFAVIWALTLLVLVGGIALGLLSDTSGGSSSGFGY
jgi:hypothetical protein